MIIGNPVITGADYREYYTGDYSIDPTTFSQVLSVSGKTMSRDITINGFIEGNGVADLIARNTEGYEDLAGAVQAVGPYAFRSCIFLNTVNLPGARRIGSYAFYDCSTLRRASIPAAERVFEYAFANCRYLIPAQDRMQISNVVRSRSIMEGMQMEAVSIDGWLRHIRTLAD